MITPSVFVDRSKLRITTGLLVLPAILLQSRLAWGAIQTVVMILLAVSSGRKFKLLPNLMVLVSVTIANILQPSGLILARVWGFPITQGALETGLHKAIILIALLYASQYMIASRPRFPGLVGTLLSMQFYYFGKITTLWRKRRGESLIQSLDVLLLSIDTTVDPSQTYEARTASSTTPVERVVAVMVFLVMWALYIYPLL